MRVAITGATGNLGTALIDALTTEPSVSSIVAISRRPNLARADPSVECVAADVAVDDLREAFRDADAVVHLAWKFQPTHRPTTTWRTNVEGSRRVFEASADAGVAVLVHGSSIGAYSPGPGRTVDEQWPTDAAPVAAYGREKSYVERVLDVFERDHPAMRVVRMRPAFVFRREVASEQRRIFAGPFVPRRLARRGALPLLPVPQGLCFQAVHAADVADAYRRVLVRDVRGPFNVAADPPIDSGVLAGLLDTRVHVVPRGLVRVAVGAAWHAHLVPVDPGLLELFLDLPLLDTTRARSELEWSPRFSSTEAVASFLEGMASGAGRAEPPLVGDSLRSRVDELRAGVGERDVL